MPFSRTSMVDSRSTIVHKKGFTLIELLIVIVIIGILATIGIYMSIGKVAQSRDAVRKSDLDKARKALELAKSECKNSEYYPLSMAISNNANQKYNNDIAGLAVYLEDSDLQYLKKSPRDPKNNSTYYYGYEVDGVGNEYASSGVCPDMSGTSNSIAGSKDYRLTSTLEKTSDPDIAKSKAKCPWSSDFTELSDYSAPTSYIYVICPD